MDSNPFSVLEHTGEWASQTIDFDNHSGESKP
jgi:hypothetical protein